MLVSKERYSHGAFDLCTGYEHIHRYLFASRYVRGKKVLDLASGEGYGTALLAQEALEVIGIDICEAVVSHATRVYQRRNLSFQVGSIEKVPLDDQFDVVVCFEALEHILDQDLLLKEVKRLLKPDGIFIVSTPNKWVYSENGKTQNPYHLKELDFTELKTLLGTYFEHQYAYGQKTVASSRIFPFEVPSTGVKEERIELGNEGFAVTTQEDPLPRYFVVVASDQSILPDEEISYLVDVAPRKGFAQWILPEKKSLSTSFTEKLRKWLF